MPEIPATARYRARPARRARGFAAVLCAVGVTAAFALATPEAGASTHALVKRTVTRHASATVTRTASATATASVSGYSATATATASATQRVVAAATATRTALASTAVRRAGAAARALALQHARQQAGAAAYTRAKVLAQQKATTLATQAATRLAHNGGAGSTTAPPAPTTVPTTTPIATPTPTSAPTSAPTAPATSTAAAPTSACGGQTPAKPSGGSWTCSFDDEFDGTSLDRTKWAVQLTSNSGFAPGGACYVDSPDTVSVSGGTLNLTVRKQAAASTCASPLGSFRTAYVAGQVSNLTSFAQTYGRYEVRAQLPPATVAGLQETFWLWPQNPVAYGAWPASGEIDFAEFYSQYAGWTIPYLHYYYDTSTTNWATDTNVVTAWPAPYAQPGTDCQIDQSGYNTYTLTWLPGQLSIQVNGNTCLVDNYAAAGLTGPAPFDKPFFLVLTQALGAGTNAPTAGTPQTATTHVDYVRVWQ